MRKIIGNSLCTIYHTRSFKKTPGPDSCLHMLADDEVHVLEVRFNDEGRALRKKDRVRMQIRMWKTHTPHFEVGRIEAIELHRKGRTLLLIEAGFYLGRWQRDIYSHFGMGY